MGSNTHLCSVHMSWILGRGKCRFELPDHDFSDLGPFSHMQIKEQSQNVLVNQLILDIKHELAAYFIHHQTKHYQLHWNCSLLCHYFLHLKQGLIISTHEKVPPIGIEDATQGLFACVGKELQQETLVKVAPTRFAVIVQVFQLDLTPSGSLEYGGCVSVKGFHLHNSIPIIVTGIAHHPCIVRKSRSLGFFRK